MTFDIVDYDEEHVDGMSVKVNLHLGIVETHQDGLVHVEIVYSEEDTHEDSISRGNFSHDTDQKFFVSLTTVQTYHLSRSFMAIETWQQIS